MDTQRVLKQEILGAIDKTGKPLWDVTPVFASEKFKLLTDCIKQAFEHESIDYVVALDALGFPLGGSVAYSLAKGLVLVRKGGKLNLPHEKKLSVSFKDYPEKEKDLETLEVRSDLIVAGKKYLIVDEWIGTGAQIKNTIDMIEGKGGIVGGIACLYCYPDFDLPIDLYKKYKLWSANCLECKYFICRCE
ncbi:hypothetical protein HDV06_005106 [Boothiomyces sp. JEL0866]|nr:hypothetical protein HDV06_005106 [Boothiomyces sp. JEL0866]